MKTPCEQKRSISSTMQRKRKNPHLPGVRLTVGLAVGPLNCLHRSPVHRTPASTKKVCVGLLDVRTIQCLGRRKKGSETSETELKHEEGGALFVSRENVSTRGEQRDRATAQHLQESCDSVTGRREVGLAEPLRLIFSPADDSDPASIDTKLLSSG